MIVNIAEPQQNSEVDLNTMKQQAYLLKKDTETRKLLAKILFLLGHFNEVGSLEAKANVRLKQEAALTAYEEAISIDRSFMKARVCAAELYFKMDLYPRAIEHFKAATYLPLRVIECYDLKLEDEPENIALLREKARYLAK